MAGQLVSLQDPDTSLYLTLDNLVPGEFNFNSLFSYLYLLYCDLISSVIVYFILMHCCYCSFVANCDYLRLLCSVQV